MCVGLGAHASEWCYAWDGYAIVGKGACVVAKAIMSPTSHEGGAQSGTMCELGGMTLRGGVHPNRHTLREAVEWRFVHAQLHPVSRVGGAHTAACRSHVGQERIVDSGGGARSQEMQPSNDPGVLSKVDSLQKTMDNPKNAMWSGAMAKVDSSSMSPAACAMPVCTDRAKVIPGENPWVVCCKPEAWRYGPNAWTLPGVGCFIRPLTKGIVIVAFRASDYIEKGLFALSDLPSFLETASGSAMLSDSVTIMDLRKLPSLGWVPYGYVVAPFYIPSEFSDTAGGPTESDGKSAARADSDPTLGYIWSYAAMDPGLCSKVSDKVWSAIGAMNTPHFERLAAVALWRERGERFAALSAGRTT